ncbi:unnamed protein product [Amaranthus hypochondriacus]
MREKVSVRRSSEKRDVAIGIQKDATTFSKSQRSRPTTGQQLVQQSQQGLRIDNPSLTHHNIRYHGLQHPQNARRPPRTVQQVNHSVKFASSRFTSFDRAGHRGFAHLPWRWVPREPTLRDVNPHVTTVFVDGLHMGMAKEWLFDMFSEYGRVMDVYISSKLRKYSKDAFGFVRYAKKEEAFLAINKLDGVEIKRKRIKVTLAKYNKYGKNYPVVRLENRTQPPKQKPIKFPSFRDERRYSDVVNGKQRIRESVSDVRNKDPNGEQGRRSVGNGVNTPAVTETRVSSWPLLRFSLKVAQNDTLASRMRLAIMGELKQGESLKKAALLIVESNLNVEWVSSIAHNTLLVFFRREEDRCSALDSSSIIWTVLSKVRNWDDTQCPTDRMVWIECNGLHPKCWSPENYKSIGEKWGEVLRIDHDRYGVNCLSYARMLIKTQQHQRIEARINVEWDLGHCEVWVKEVDWWSVVRDDNGEAYVEEEDMVVEEGNTGNKEEAMGMHEIRSQSLELVDRTCLEVQNTVALVENHGRNSIDKDTSSEGIVVSENEFDEQHKEMYAYTPINVTRQHRSNSSMQLQPINSLEEVEGSREENDTPDITQNGFASSVDEMIVGHFSCPEPRIECDFDPMAAIECSLPLSTQEGVNATVAKAATCKKSRGRPKRVGNSLPATLSVESTPSSCSVEAADTWGTGKRLGLATRNDDSLVSELRKSKRIQIMEESRREQVEV